MPAPLHALVFSILSQLVGFAIAVFLAQLGAPPALAVSAHGGSALLIAHWLKLSLPWKAINLTIPFAIVSGLGGVLPDATLNAITILAILLFVPTLWTRVPYYPSHPNVIREVAQLLPRDNEFTFVDLGCGGGTLLRRLAQRFPNGRFIGFEISPLAFVVSWMQSFLLGENRVRIRPRSFWNESLSKYDFVYCFLAPPPMAALWDKAKKEMKPGAIFITNSFPVPERAVCEIEIGAGLQTKLYVHTIAERVKR